MAKLCGGWALKRVVRKMDPEYIKFGFMKASSDGELNAVCSVWWNTATAQVSLLFATLISFSYIWEVGPWKIFSKCLFSYTRLRTLETKLERSMSWLFTLFWSSCCKQYNIWAVPLKCLWLIAIVQFFNLLFHSVSVSKHQKPWCLNIKLCLAD